VSVEPHHRFDGPEAAPVLVLSNSLGTTLEMWDELVPALSERFRVLRYDTRGHGRSPVPPGPYSIDDLGRDALALLDRLGLERVSFCGVSLGGMTGMWLAAHAPDRIERLALCCSSAHMPPPEMWTERADAVRSHGVAALADATLGRWFTPAASERRPGAVERLRRGLLGVAPEGYAACCEAIRDMDLRPALRSIRAPTLVIAAEDDPSTPPDQHGRVIAESIDGARLVVLAEGRHLVVVERPDEVAPLLLDHLVAEAAV
jgi:3-oxoadipate enol-lactonase